MATKQVFEAYLLSSTQKFEVNGYAINDLVGLAQHPEKKHWVGVHIPTGMTLERGSAYRFKQKRECMAFLESLIEQGFDFDVSTSAECVEKNPDYEEMFKKAVDAAKRA